MNADLHMLVVEVLGMVLMAGVGYLKTLQFKREGLQGVKDNVLAVVQTAVTDVYHEYVADIKEAREDGKLTAEEKDTAREMATGKVKARLKAAGIDFVTTYGGDVLSYLIEVSVNRMKDKPQYD